MRILLPIAVVATFASPAFACGEPAEEWYHDNSDAVVDGVARCDAERRSCKVRVTRIVKNDGYSLDRGGSIDLDFVEFQFIEFSETQIVYSCGSPLFEPQFSRFSGRFYLNFDRATGEAVVRRHRIRASDGTFWREDFCTESDGDFQCNYE